MKLDEFKYGKKEDAFFVISEVAKDLKVRGIQYWDPDFLDQESLFKKFKSEEIITGYVQGHVAAAVILIFYDPEVWPEIRPGESSFIHKLSVLPRYQGMGVAKQLVHFADQVSKSKGVKYTRLDCGSDRTKLCNFYQELGYKKIEEKLIGVYPSTLFERCI